MAIGPYTDCRESPNDCASFELQTDTAPDSLMSCASGCALLAECMETAECENMCVSRQWQVDTMECWEAQLAQGVSCAQMECYQPFADSSSSSRSIALPVLLSLLGGLGGFIVAMVVMRRKQQQERRNKELQYEMLIDDEDSTRRSAL